MLYIGNRNPDRRLTILGQGFDFIPLILRDDYLAKRNLLVLVTIVAGEAVILQTPRLSAAFGMWAPAESPVATFVTAIAVTGSEVVQVSVNQTC
jgi:hypothetical protein